MTNETWEDRAKLLEAQLYGVTEWTIRLMRLLALDVLRLMEGNVKAKDTEDFLFSFQKRISEGLLSIALLSAYNLSRGTEIEGVLRKMGADTDSVYESINRLLEECKQACFPEGPTQ